MLLGVLHRTGGEKTPWTTTDELSRLTGFPSGCTLCAHSAHMLNRLAEWTLVDKRGRAWCIMLIYNHRHRHHEKSTVYVSNHYQSASTHKWCPTRAYNNVCGPNIADPRCSSVKRAHTIVHPIISGCSRRWFVKTVRFYTH